MEQAARILRIITRLNIGGPARQALLLTKALKPEFDTTLVTGFPQEREGELTDPEVRPERVDLVRPISPRSDVRALRHLRRTLDHVQPSLMHTHMAKAGFLGRIAALTCHARPLLVHTFHGHVLEGYFGPVKERLFISMERAAAARTDVLIAVSEEVRDSLLSLRIGRPDQYRVIPLGFDLSSFLAVDGQSGALRTTLGIPIHVPVVGVLGRLAPIKDHLTLVRAVARLPGVHLVILGDGELRSEIERYVSDHHLSDRVHLVGWRLDVASSIADCDVVALTSLNEGTPVSLIEAGAAQRPVVATDVGGVRSVVQHNSNGFLVPVRDPEAVAERLRTLLDSTELRKTMGRAGRLRVTERFDQRRLVRDIRDLYTELMNMRVDSPPQPRTVA